jgi:hypothetical protein
MLVQIDGSHHCWLEERGPWFTLLLAVDDATGTVPYALFQEQEDTEGYFRLMMGIIRQRGIPLALYSDRHAVFQHQGRPVSEGSPGAGASEPTQFGRALRELGATQVFAHSPEAKGRVERANGTFQDRLVVELRLAGANTLAEANGVLGEFLPRFNKRFGAPADQRESAYRPVDPELDLGSVLCIKELRRVAKDNTVQYHGRSLQLFPDLERPSYAGARVEVQERLDGRLLVRHRHQILTPQEAPALAAELRNRVSVGPVRAKLPDPDPTDWRPEQRVRAPVIPGPLAGEPIWYEDAGKKRVHSDLTRAGVERARQEGKRIGRPWVTEREGFSLRWQGALGRLQSGELSRQGAAQELGISYPTLKRLLDSTTPVEPHRQAKENGTAGNTPDVPSPPAHPI